MSVLRIWGRNRESNWNEYWTMNRILSASNQLSAELENRGVTVADICPKLVPHVSLSHRQVEMFISAPNFAVAEREMCEVIQKLTGCKAEPSPASSEEEFNTRARQNLLYVRQAFEPWDKNLPCLILGVDFDCGRHQKQRPAEPSRWRLINHQYDGNYNDKLLLPAMILEPKEKGKNLLAELTARFERWYGGSGFHGRPPLNAILEYREVLKRYGVDCNEAFHDNLGEGLYPIDIDTDVDIQRARELCATSLPDNLGDLLIEDGGPVRKYGANFHFAALTE